MFLFDKLGTHFRVIVGKLGSIGEKSRDKFEIFLKHIMVQFSREVFVDSLKNKLNAVVLNGDYFKIKIPQNKNFKNKFSSKY